MSSDTPYHFEQGNGYSVISLTPQLNDAQWSDIEQVGTDLLDQLGNNKSLAFVVDLSALNYMGSAMVALIVRLWKSVKDEKKGRMVVVNKEKMVYEVLELAGLHKIWTIVETREEALRQLGIKVSAPTPTNGAPVSSGSAPAGTGSNLPLMLAVLGTAAALIGAAMTYKKIIDPVAANMAIGLVGAIVGLIFAVQLASTNNNNNRTLGIVLLVVNLLMAGATIMSL